MIELLLFLFIISSIYSLFTQEKMGTFSKEDSIKLKGLLALGIVFHHLSEKVAFCYPLSLLSQLGSPIVAVFFFISGYGLMKSLLLNGRISLRKRINKVLYPYIIAIVFYNMSSLIDGKQIVLSDLFAKLLIGNVNPLLPFSWYILSMLFLYIFFYLSFKRNNIRSGLFLCLLVSIIYIFLLKECHWGGWWYCSILAFNVGLFYSYKETFIRKILTKKSYFYGLLSFLFFVAFVLTHFGETRLSFYILEMSLFPLIVILLVCKFGIHLPFLKYLGLISYEIYLLQGISMHFLRGNNIYIKSDGLYVFFCFIFTIFFAILMNKLLSKIKYL